MSINETSKEEQIIYKIIDEILQTEDRISELNLKITKDDNNNHNKSLTNLSSEKQINILKIKELQEELITKLQPFNKQKEIKEDELTQLQAKVTQITSYLKTLAQSAKGNIYKMSYEKIEEMINNKKSLDDMQMMEQDMSTTTKLRLLAFTSLSELKNKHNEINECLKMLKEEKEMYKDDIVNLVSQKESIEEMIKIHFNFRKNNNGERINNNEELIEKHCNYNKNIEVFYYEIERADMNKTSMEICEFLMENFRYDMPINQDKNENYSHNDIQSQKIQRVHIVNSLKNEIIEYLNQRKKPHKTANTSTEDFINKLSKQLINIIQVNKPQSNTNIITENSFALYLKCIFKISYYDDSIQHRLTFIDKDYKTTKKYLENLINNTQINITKLSTQLNEIDYKVNEIKRKKDIIFHNTKSKNIIELSPKEKDFIQQNEALNILSHDKEFIGNELEDIYAQIKDLKEQYETKITLIKKDINHIDCKKELLLKEMEEEQINASESIIQLRKTIVDKYALIKTQLKLYREKNGNNLTLCNKLVNNINNTIKRFTTIGKNDMFNERSFYAPSSRFDTFRTNGKGNDSKNLNTPSSSSMNNIQNQMYYNQQEEDDDDDNYIISSKNDLNENNDENTYDYNNRTIQPKIFHCHNKSEISQSLTTDRIIINDQAIAWVKERDKLNQTIRSLKAKISKTKIISDRFSAKQKLKPLNEFTLCYYRFYSKNDAKFNPLINDLYSNSLSFVKASVMINDEYTNLLLQPSTEKNIRKIIPIELIENTIVSKIVKHIVLIYRENKKMKGKENIEEMMKKVDFESVSLSKADKVKAMVNKHFNFSIQIRNDDERIELVFLSYEEFKVWINGLSYLIKNKGFMNKYKVLLK